MSRDSLPDLHLEKGGRTRHVRLISEGGSSPAWSPGPVCIDSIQVTQTCTTESNHSGYRSATGACAMFSSPDTALFSIPSTQVRQLDREGIPPILRNRFRQHGLPLSESAAVEVREPGRVWVLCDGGRRYAVRKVPGHLTVYREPLHD